MLNHGGQLRIAKQQYPEVGDWLDLSTGISPWSWPVPEIPVAVWSRLPDAPVSIRQAAANYYGCSAEDVIPMPGSQAAIQWLPESIESSSVAIPRWGYGEHAHCWQRAGHRVIYYDSAEQVTHLLAAKQVDHLLVINPNNPSADNYDPEQLSQWQSRLAATGGYLIVDQAFADVEDAQISSRLYGIENVIVMRSVGKFFGMAGLRLGFVIAAQVILDKLSARSPLWTVSNAALFLGEKMLTDQNWQQQQKRRIDHYNRRLVELLAPHFGRTRLCVGPLFISIFGADAELKACHQGLAKEGVWVRYFEPVDEQSCLRFGLADDSGLVRLRDALAKLNPLTEGRCVNYET